MPKKTIVSIRLSVKEVKMLEEIREHLQRTSTTPGASITPPQAHRSAIHMAYAQTKLERKEEGK